jgi:photosystem II stability/assembly factor-like uncharacterized protein
MKKRALVASITAAVFAASAGMTAEAADVTVGQSGWNWGNPQPQGNTLRTVEFSGGRGYAAGDFGTLLRTDNGGGSWTGIPTGITADLARIRAVDEDTVVIGSGCVLRRSDDGGTTFKRLPFTPSETNCAQPISSLYFASEQVGYVLQADGTVVRTANGGQSFSGRTAVPGTEATTPAGRPATPTDILFTSEDTGFATVDGPSGGVVYRTTDGGNTWVQSVANGDGLTSLYFTDPLVGYVVGKNSTVLKTEDGGDTWDGKSVLADIPRDDLTSIRCATQAICLISTAGGERVLRTTDGGDTITSFNPSTRKIFAVSFASSTSAVGVGERGATVLSTNATAASPSFTPVGDQPLAGTFNRMRATTTSLVYAPGDNGKLARSTDAGHGWAILQVPTSEDLLDAWFVDGDHGYVLDTSGKAQKTLDAGSSWSLLDTGTTDQPSAVYAIDQNLVMLFGPRGIRRSENGGDTPFERVDSKAARTTTLSDYDRTDGATLFAYGPRKIIASSDRGLHWRQVKGPVKKPRYQKVDFVTSRIGYALTTDGRVWRTANGGRKWSELLGVGTSNAYDISFGDANSGFLSVSLGAPNGWVYRTSDAGATWRPQLIEPQPVATRGLATPATNAAFALAGPSDLFYTTSGGDQGPQTTLTLKPVQKRVKKTTRVKLTGKLDPKVAGARLTVYSRPAKSNAWSVVDRPTVSASGTYNTAKRVTTTTYFVAQWRGDADHNGDGSPAVKVVKVAKKRKRK